MWASDPEEFGKIFTESREVLDWFISTVLPLLFFPYLHFFTIAVEQVRQWPNCVRA